MRKSAPVLVQLLTLILLLSVLITLLNMLGIPNPFYNPFSRPAAVPRPVAPPPGELGAEEKANIEVFKRISPSVTYITSSAIVIDFFTRRMNEIPQGTGSGFVWDSDGHIVTNYHVIQDARSVKVGLHDQTLWDAAIIGADPDKDLAVLRIGAAPSQLQPVMIGTSNDLQVGQKVLAIGNPFGLSTTLTVGIISALDRTIETETNHTIFDVIQTDAAINPGNSGGPLLDSFGRVIGVNTAILSPSGSNAGIGFAVPIDTINRIVPQLIARGRTANPYLGVVVLNDSLVERLESLGFKNLEGAVIRGVARNSPADRAGLIGMQQDAIGRIAVGDIIVAVNGKPVKNQDDLYRWLDSYSPGDEITLRVRRAGTERDVTLRLDVRPN